MFEAKGICKYFAGVTALDHVDFTLYPGEIHGLLGENGAGKSTLMKIMSGVYTLDEGELLDDGKLIRISNERDALRQGISIISQELSLCESLSVAENIFMGDLPTTGIGAVNWPLLYENGRKVLQDLGLSINPRIKVGKLSTSQKQMVEIAKSVNRKSKIILMDEPTSALTSAEVEYLFAKMRELAGQGIALVFVSHKLDEVYEICDRITILRDGRRISSFKRGEQSMPKTIEMMIGKTLDEQFEGAETDETQTVDYSSKDIVMSVRDLRTAAKLKGISFDLYRGEILGLYGLMGSGRTEILRAIYGVDRTESMELTVQGKRLHKISPAISIKNGVVLIPEERKLQSLFLQLSVTDNISIPNLDQITVGPFLQLGKRKEMVDSCIREMSVKTPDSKIQIRNLSGGNQQKAIIGRWLYKKPAILLMDEPTKGIDVGAKAEIYRLIRRFSRQGYSVICISSEVEEIERLCDRVLLIREGAVVGELERSEISLVSISAGLSSKIGM